MIYTFRRIDGTVVRSVAVEEPVVRWLAGDGRTNGWCMYCGGFPGDHRPFLGNLCPLDIAVQRLDGAIATVAASAEPEASPVPSSNAEPVATPVPSSLPARSIDVAVALAFFGAGLAVAVIAHALVLP